MVSRGSSTRTAGQTTPPIAVDWVKRHDDEQLDSYVKRAFALKPEHGLARGQRDLGLRRPRVPLDDQRARVFTASPLPFSSDEHKVSDILVSAGFRGIRLNNRTRVPPDSSRWFFQATSPSEDAIFNLNVQGIPPSLSRPPPDAHLSRQASPSPNRPTLQGAPPRSRLPCPLLATPQLPAFPLQRCP